jgi:competence protein ComEC
LAAALFPALALIASATAGITLALDAHAGAWCIPVFVVGAVVAWYRVASRITAALIVSGFACCGVALGADARARALDSQLRRAIGSDMHGPIVSRMRLTEDATDNADRITLRGRITFIRLHDVWIPADGGVVVSVGGGAAAARALEWRRGRTLEAPITFRRPARYLNDGVGDFERAAALDGITLLGSIKSALVVDLLRPGTFASERAADVRDYVRQQVRRRVEPHSALSAAIVSAVLIGDRSGLPDDIRERLQAAGTYHVIAISGGNIAILTALLFAVLVPIGLVGRGASLATLLLLVAYAAIVTAGPSVWRATLVAIAYLFARLLDHRTPPWQAMALAGALLAIIEPLDVRNAGFLLTFGATAALLHVVGRGAVGPPKVAWLTMSIASSAAVEIALLPVMAETFSRVSVAGLVLNVVAVPAMAVVQIAGLVVVMASHLETIGRIAGWSAHLGSTAIVSSARLVDAAPWLAFRVPPPAPLVVVAYYVGLGALIASRRTVARAVSAFALVVAALTIVSGFRIADDIRGLRLTMVDVGQGEAMVLQIAGGHTVMVDSGGAPFGSGGFDIGTRVVEPALWTRGVSSLGALLFTHGDPDHIGGAMPLIQDFRPAAVWQGVPVPRARSLQQVLARATAAGIPIEERRAGEQFSLGAARVFVLHPSAPDWERQRVRNDDSVVLEVVYGDLALLLTGDIGADVERQIVPALLPAKTRILKVAHHGSRTSTSQALLDAWHPQIALISCGRDNAFGHPAPEVVARLESIGARIYRTDRDGEITLATDGQHVVVRTFTGKEL